MTGFMLELTADYAASVLMAILPAISDFAGKLDLAVPAPLSTNDVARFVCHRIPGQFGGQVVLKNGLRFLYQGGIVQSFESTNCYSTLQVPELAERFIAVPKISREEAVAITRQKLTELGYRPESCFVLPAPKVEGPHDIGLGVVPHFEITWLDPRDGTRRILVEINGANRHIERLEVLAPEFEHPPPVLSGAHREKQLKNASLDRRNTERVATTAELLGQLDAQVAEFSKRLGLSVPRLTEQSVAIIKRFTSSHQMDVWLTSGERFRFEPDNRLFGFFNPGSFFPRETTNRVQSFFGKSAISDEEAETIARKSLAKLGYQAPKLGLDKPARIRKPVIIGNYSIPRTDFAWDVGEGLELRGFLAVEVDTQKARITSIRVSDAERSLLPLKK